MLSSTAKNLYWMARYIQRAENTARMLEATNRMALLSGSDREWRSVPLIYGRMRVGSVVVSASLRAEQIVA